MYIKGKFNINENVGKSRMFEKTGDEINVSQTHVLKMVVEINKTESKNGKYNKTSLAKPDKAELEYLHLMKYGIDMRDC